MGQQNQRQQPCGLGHIRTQLHHQASKEYGLVAQINADRGVTTAGGIALVKDQIDHRQNRIDPPLQRFAIRNFKRYPRFADFAARAGQPLAHRCRPIQIGAGDFLGCQPAKGAQGQGNAGLFIQRGVTTGENQPQAVVGNVVGISGGIRLGFFQNRNLRKFLGQAFGASEPVQRLAACHL